ncbi:endonuclease NucS domain-containing protein [Embleya sp. NPDC059259]|uniref:endonuclease NucS domain-containing protein n=1 Tax=unclassified Embleya TaxID=2699296 RepID=UPI0036AFC23A
MPTGVAMWRVDGDGARRLRPARMPLEHELESLIEADPDILGKRLLVIGRQVRTTHGGVVDLLAVDGEGTVHVIELKRDRGPREVIAQVLDYASWIATVSHTEIQQIFAKYNDGVETFEAAFERRFDTAAPQELNTAHRLTVVAARLDDATERILTYLGDLGVPINAAAFEYYEDHGSRYLARTMLRDDTNAPAAKPAPMTRTREPWTGEDWYSALGEDGIRSWDDARRLGFVSAGGGTWFSQGLRRPRIGHRVHVYIPRVGYVGVGEVDGEIAPFVEARVKVDGRHVRLAEQTLAGTYRHPGDDTDPDLAEYVLPVRWLSTVDRIDAVREQGMFASQHPMCRLHHAATLAILRRAFSPTQTV